MLSRRIIQRRGAGVALACLLLAYVWPISASGDADQTALSWLRPGEKGFGISVLRGTEPDTFPIEVVSVVDRGKAGGSFVLVRATEGEVSRKGFAAGMSGSPIYVDSKLVGAVSFVYVGTTEPLAGVRPAYEMRADLVPASENPRSSDSAYGRAEELPPYPEWVERSMAEPNALLGVRGNAGQGIPQGLQSLPITLAGPLGEYAEPLLDDVLPAGLGPVTFVGAGAGSGEDSLSNVQVEPGAAVAVKIIGGDLNAAAIGTATWIDGERVYAFGHSFLSVGPTCLPFASAMIHAVIPTLNGAFKLGTALGEVGALVEDRQAGVAAVLGRRAPRTSLEVTIQGDGGQTDAYRFWVAQNELLVPGLVAAAVGAAVKKSGYDLGAATVASKLEIVLAGGKKIVRSDLARTINVTRTVEGMVLAPVSYVTASTFEPRDMDSIRVWLSIERGIRAVSIEEVRLAVAEARPGTDLPVRVLLREHFGGWRTVEAVLHVPAWAIGRELVVVAASPAAILEWDSGARPERYVPRSIDDLIDIVSEYPSNACLVLRLYGPSRGILLKGRDLPSLPLSKFLPLNRAGSSPGSVPTGGLILDERVIDIGSVVLGGASTRVMLRKP